MDSDTARNECRKAFEKWAEERALNCIRDKEDLYRYENVDRAWKTWLAASLRLAAENARLRELIKSALALKGGWREAIVELEDHCADPVRLKNMLAAADQLDEWSKEAQKVLGKSKDRP